MRCSGLGGVHTMWAVPRRLLPLLASLALVAPAADAHGFVGHGADSAQLRPLRGPRTASPRNAGLIRVRRAHGGTWRARVDAAGVPVRVFGSGVAAPGAIADADRARGHAVAMLSRHIAWLAPGSTAADFRVVANRALRGVRSVSLQQVHRGLPVVGAYVYFAFKRDRLVMFGSRAIPHPRGASGVGGSALYPLVQPDESYRLHRVRSYTVDTVAPFGRWAIYEDVVTGKVVARRSLVFAGAGQVLFKVPDRGPTGSRGDYPASYAEVTVDGSGQTTDADGNVSWAGGAPAALTTEVDGTFVNVDNQAGADITGGFSLADGGSVTWDVSTTEFDDAQLSAFVHANRAKDAARVMDPGLTWLDGTLTVRVNAKGDCNAFSLGDALLFFRSGMFDGQPCQNPARIADIVLHEVGHSVHIAAIVPGMGDTNPALGEGLADYFAATILDDPALADGFIGVGPLRHLDPKTGEAVWPTDIDGDSHITGLIIGGALWDLRKALIAKLGASAGKTLADQLFYSVMQRAPDIPGSYAAVLLEDDDDGNLSNGTPNKCVIDAVFLAHGLGDAGAAGSLISNDGLAVSVRDLAVEPGCPTITGAELVWRLRGDSGAGTTIAMTQTGSEWNAAIPDQAGDTVVEYQVLLTSSIGATTAFPRNGAAPWYQVYVGTAEQIYCTDFETDVLAGDWTT